VDPDVFITICFAAFVAVLTALGAWAGVRAARDERGRRPG
jgi:hypothetical protein